MLPGGRALGRGRDQCPRESCPAPTWEEAVLPICLTQDTGSGHIVVYLARRQWRSALEQILTRKSAYVTTAQRSLSGTAQEDTGPGHQGCGGACIFPIPWPKQPPSTLPFVLSNARHEGLDLHHSQWERRVSKCETTENGACRGSEGEGKSRGLKRE